MKKQILKIFFLFVAFLLLPNCVSADTATLYSPFNGIIVNGTVQLSTTTDVIDAAGTGNTVDHVEYYIDGQLYKTYTYATDIARIRVKENGVADGYTYSSSTSPKNPNPFAVTWDTTAYGNGDHQIYSITYPVAGGSLASQTNTVTVNNAAYSEVVPMPLADISERTNVAGTVHISGGHLATPYVVNTANREYILDSDITADNTAIKIQTSHAVINLNGHKITYNMISDGDGIVSGGWNYHDIAITNGVIIQGSAMSEGDQYGTYNNPIRMAPYTVSNLQIANIYARYGGRDVGGFFLQGSSNVIVEKNTLEDTFLYGTVKNRQQGVDAINAIINAPGIIRNNTIVNARHRGVQVGGGDEVYGNTIGIRSICTNSYGVFNWSKNDTQIHDNIITSAGEMDIGIAVHGNIPGPPVNNRVYNNTVTSQVTRIGVEYGSSFDAGTCGTSDNPCVSDLAVGFRSTTGADKLYVYDNVFNVVSDANYLGAYSPNGAPAYLNAGARGIWAEVDDPDHSAVYSDNTVVALDSDGTGMAEGIACSGHHEGGPQSGSKLVFSHNTVTSNIQNVAISDAYGDCLGHPLFIQNTFIKAGNFPGYHTIGNGTINGYVAGTARFVSNVFQGGASVNDLDLDIGQYLTRNTTLTASMDAYQTSLTVSAGAGFVAGDVVRIEDEYVKVGTVSGTTFSSLTRGMYGTMPTTHGNGTAVLAYEGNTGSKEKSLIFGRLMGATVKDASYNPLQNVELYLRDQTGALQFENAAPKTGAGGTAQFMVNDYEINNNKGLSATAIHIDFRPHAIEVQGLFTTASDNSASAWDSLASSGIHTITDANGSIEINTDGGEYIPPSSDTTPPASPTGLSVL